MESFKAPFRWGEGSALTVSFDPWRFRFFAMPIIAHLSRIGDLSRLVTGLTSIQVKASMFEFPLCNYQIQPGQLVT